MSYDNDSPNRVFFDDFQVVHTKTHVIQYNEYYPYGLRTSNSWTREQSENNFLYNGGTERNASSGYYDLFYRNYDPAIGRFVQVDPMAVSEMATYQYSASNPVMFSDPLGSVKVKKPDPPDRSNIGWLKYAGPIRAGEMYWDGVYGMGGGGGGGGSGGGSGGSGSGGHTSVADFIVEALIYSEYGGHWSNGTTTLYQDADDFYNYFDVEEYHQVIDRGSDWYGTDDGIAVNRYEVVDGIRLVPIAQQGGATMYGWANEADAYNYMWNNSFRSGQPYSENFGWITTKGVLVLPLTKNSKVDESDWSVLPTKKINNNWHVQHNGEWIKVLAAIHTHPNNSHMLSPSDLYMSSQWGVPIFAIELPNLWVGYGPNYETAKYHQPITATQNIFSGNISIYNDLLPLLPK